jgi:hypothetical protein
MKPPYRSTYDLKIEIQAALRTMRQLGGALAKQAVGHRPLGLRSRGDPARVSPFLFLLVVKCFNIAAEKNIRLAKLKKCITETPCFVGAL